MEWFPVAPQRSSRRRLTRVDARSSVRRGKSSQPSSASNAAAVSAQNTPLRRYRNAVWHPDSAIESSGQLSPRALRRVSKRIAAAPNTPLQLPDSWSSLRDNQEDPELSAISGGLIEAAPSLRVPKSRFVISPETPLNHDDSDGTDTESLPQQASREPIPIPGPQSPTPSRSMGEIDQSPFRDFSGHHFVGNDQEDDPFAGSKRSLDPPRTPDDDSRAFAPRAPNSDASPPELVGMGRDQRSVAHLFRVDRGEVRRPQLVNEKMLELKCRGLDVEDAAGSMDEGLLPALPTKDPPLYDNLRDKMRQMAVDLWLLRSKIAYSMEEWKAMEQHSQQAHDLADDLQWEPFVAKCAFPLGIALFNQKDWLGAYENFEEAEKTRGYYIPRSELLRWLTMASAQLDQSAAPSLFSMSAGPGERAPFITPLDSVVEEKEEYPFPAAEDQKPRSEDFPTFQYSMQESGHETGVAGASLPSRALLAFSPQAPLEFSQAPVTEATKPTARAPSLARSVASHPFNNTSSISPTDRILRLPARPARAPAAVTLANNPAPASISSPRLYDPGPHPNPSPPMRANTPPLRTALYVPRSHAASSLSEMELPGPAISPTLAQNSGRQDTASGPDRAIPWGSELEQDHQQPLNPSLLFERKRRSSPALSPLRDGPDEWNQAPLDTNSPTAPALLDSEDLNLISPLTSEPASPSRLITNNLAGLSAKSESNSPTDQSRQSESEASLPQTLLSPPAAIGMTHPNLSTLRPTASPQSPTPPPPPPPPPESQPKISQDSASPPPTYPPSPRSALRHRDALESARIESAIARIKAIASPRVRSARSSAGVFTSPRASVLHSPPRPGSSSNHRPLTLSRGQSIYAVRPKGKRAISDGSVYGKGMKVVRDRSARPGSSIKWRDGWTRRGGTVRDGEGGLDDKSLEGNEEEDVDSDAGEGEERSAISESGSEENEDGSSEDSGVKGDDGKGSDASRWWWQKRGWFA
ncbi:MAG: hypothetical protein LQ338_005445 [Usnochroma carphineum]|nr:MAG: hypothetical protein LQ338_005445 [Usnochroma carphineum]